MMRKPVALIFSDDSTLIFACRMRDAILKDAPECPVKMVWYTEENALSYRQMCQLLPQGPDRVLTRAGLSALVQDNRFSAVIVSRVYAPISFQIRKSTFRWKGDRPCVIAFLGGLDFFEHNGFARRRLCDGVFLFPNSAIERYHATVKDLDAGWQRVDFGHPAVTMNASDSAQSVQSRSDIFFFTQAISPLTRRSRLHMLEVMIAIAQANPARNVFIKLRHLPDENQSHLHREKYDYPSLLAGYPSLPHNLLLTDIDMDEALHTAAIGITCTSTAALDLVRAGVPCMIYLDYVDNYRDRLKNPMQALFRDSNLVTPLDQILHLQPNAPDPDWVADMLCPPDLGRRVMDMIDAFDARPLQIIEDVADTVDNETDSRD